MKSISTLALLAAAEFFIGGATVAPAPARAADLGGDCCADLETRVAELEATTARKGNKKVSLAITGRVNFNILYWNENSTGPSAAANDQTHDLYFGNVGRNESEIVLKGDGKISSDVTAGFSMEIYVDPTGNNGTSPAQHTQITTQGAPALQAQTTYVFLKSKTAGELRLGNQYDAMREVYFGDLGVDTIGRYAQTRQAATFFLRDTAGNLTNLTYQNALKPIDGSRYDQIQYITPALAGFTGKANVGGDNSWSLGLFYDNKFGNVAVKAGVGYEQGSEIDGSANTAAPVGVQVKNDVSLTTSTIKNVNASASISESTSGLYLSGVYAQSYADKAGRQDGSNWMIKGGWQKNVSGLGTTAIYGSYFQENNMLANDTRGHIWAVGIDQAIDSVASNIYLQYQRDSFDTNGITTASVTALTPVGSTVNSQSIDEVIGGMIIRF